MCTLLNVDVADNLEPSQFLHFVLPLISLLTQFSVA